MYIFIYFSLYDLLHLVVFRSLIFKKLDGMKKNKAIAAVTSHLHPISSRKHIRQIADSLLT